MIHCLKHLYNRRWI